MLDQVTRWGRYGGHAFGPFAELDLSGAHYGPTLATLWNDVRTVAPAGLMSEHDNQTVESDPSMAEIYDAYAEGFAAGVAAEKALRDEWEAARAASWRYAALNAATAAELLRGEFPTAAAVEFDLEHDHHLGWSADLMVIRDSQGEALWSGAEDEELLDDISVITDPLATAHHWCYDYFRKTNDGMYAMDIDTAIERGGEIRKARR